MRDFTILTTVSSVLLGCTGEITVDERPRSLAGTVTDGALGVDDRGQFVADDDAVRLFDYFLTAEGEVDDDAIRQLVIDEITDRLSGDAADQAMEAFTRYQEYRARMAEILSAAGQSPEDARERMHALYASLVSDLPGLVDEPARIDRAFALRAALAESCVDAATRSACIARVDATTTPEAERVVEAEARAASRVMLDLRNAESRVVGASAIRAVRLARVGPAATARLEQLDRARADWRRRLASYRSARADQIRTMTSSRHRDRVLAELLSDHFDAGERRRVQALDRAIAPHTRPATPTERRPGCDSGVMGW